MKNVKLSILLMPTDFWSRVVDGWVLYDAKSKNQKKTTAHNPKQNPEKIEHQRGSEMLIETQDNELIIHPLVSDPIKEVCAVFGKETLYSRELKKFLQTSRIISKVQHQF